MAASSKSVPGRELFRPRCGARCIIAIAGVASRAVGYGSARVITSATGLTEAQRLCRTSRCWVVGITVRSTKTAIRASDSPTAGLCPKAPLSPRCPAIPLECYERGTTSAGLTSTHQRQCLFGSESGSTSAGRSTSCTRWRLLDDVLLDALHEPEHL